MTKITQDSGNDDSGFQGIGRKRVGLCKYCGCRHKLGREFCKIFGKSCNICKRLNHAAKVCWFAEKRKMEFRNLRKGREADAKAQKFENLQDSTGSDGGSKVEMNVSDAKNFSDFSTSKESIAYNSYDTSGKLPNERCKHTLNEEIDATEPKEVLEGKFGYSVLQTGLSRNQIQESKQGIDNFEQNVQDSAKPKEKVSKYQKLLNESLEIEDAVGNFEIETQGFRNYILNLIENADEIEWFERNWIRNVVTDLGGIVLGKFVEKLRQLKNEEARKGSNN